jgi:hypothetical protein
MRRLALVAVFPTACGCIHIDAWAGSGSGSTGTSALVFTTWIDRSAGRVLKSHATSTREATFGDPSGSTPPTIITDDARADLLPGWPGVTT